jgi:hypothetical protein
MGRIEQFTMEINPTDEFACVAGANSICDHQTLLAIPSMSLSRQDFQSLMVLHVHDQYPLPGHS